MVEALRTPAEVVDLAITPKPELIIHAADLPSTALALRNLLATSDQLFDRGVPARFVQSADGTPAAVPMTKNNVIVETHRLCQPVAHKSGAPTPVTLPDRVAQMYLDMTGEWMLRPLAGFSMSPLLSPAGELRSVNGYDSETALWCSQRTPVNVPTAPTTLHAAEALKVLRSAFRTFPFADAARVRDANGVEIIDQALPPGIDESAFLIGLMTACCRSSLWLAPGLLLTAPSLSGAGSGKGLLIRALCTIAFGFRPNAFTTGSDRQELEKRLAAELVEAQPALFLDNANGIGLKSDMLASVLTERPARVRLLGQTRMVPLNSTAFIAVTGNGLSVTEDLARRFICCKLDARCEDPESRRFQSGFLDQIQSRRSELLSAALTIWRWGRQNGSSLMTGKPLGSFETWTEWCRDPLLTLGCADPVERIEALKALDPKRQRAADFFQAWWEAHQDVPIKLKDLNERVAHVVDEHARGRQYLASRVANFVGTQVAGLVLTRQEGAGKWSAATYQLKKTATEAQEHRPHRTHRPPMSPMIPMRDATDGEFGLLPGREAKL